MLLAKGVIRIKFLEELRLPWQPKDFYKRNHKIFLSKTTRCSFCQKPQGVEL
jgi:hypothetical protein